MNIYTLSDGHNINLDKIERITPIESTSSGQYEFYIHYEYRSQVISDYSKEKIIDEHKKLIDTWRKYCGMKYEKR